MPVWLPDRHGSSQAWWSKRTRRNSTRHWWSFPNWLPGKSSVLNGRHSLWWSLRRAGWWGGWSRNFGCSSVRLLLPSQWCQWLWRWGWSWDLNRRTQVYHFNLFWLAGSSLFHKRISERNRSPSVLPWSFNDRAPVSISVISYIVHNKENAEIEEKHDPTSGEN